MGTEITKWFETFQSLVEALSAQRNDILPTLSLLISILALFVSVSALRYRRKQFELAQQQFEQTQRALEEQKQKQRFSARISDTYYHHVEVENGRQQLEYLGAVLNLDNPSGSSVFVRYLAVKLVFTVADTSQLSSWHSFLLWAKLVEAIEATSITVPYPPTGQTESTQTWSLAPFPIGDARYKPQCWLFDKRNDELLTLEVPFEIQRNIDTVLWELVVYIPPALGKAAQQFNLRIHRMDIQLVLVDGSTQSLKARFRRQFGPVASSREKVIRLIEQAQAEER